jgi:hypothetical protein
MPAAQLGAADLAHEHIAPLPGCERQLNEPPASLIGGQPVVNRHRQAPQRLIN